MGILFGLSAAFSWGISDFFATTVARRLGSRRALMLTQAVSFTLALLLVMSQGSIPHSSASIWRLAFFLGAMNFIATQLLYRAFQIGTLSLVSPLASSYTVVTALLALATGERPSLTALCGASFLLLGVILATQSPRDTSPTDTGLGTDTDARTDTGSKPASSAGLLEAGVAALCFGIVFWGIDRVTPSLGIFMPVLMLRLVTLIGSTILWYVWVKRGPRDEAATDAIPPSTSDTGSPRLPLPLWGTIVLVACCDTAAWLGVSAGTRTEYTTVVTALSSLFSGITVLLARTFLKEQLSKIQWLGVTVILLGILFVSIR